jgi:hypothetical protein
LSFKFKRLLNRRYEHPLLIEGREKTEWVLPITVHAPPPRTPTSGSRNEKLFSLDPMWVNTWRYYTSLIFTELVGINRYMYSFSEKDLIIVGLHWTCSTHHLIYMVITMMSESRWQWGKVGVVLGILVPWILSPPWLLYLSLVQDSLFYVLLKKTQKGIFDPCWQPLITCFDI